MLCRVILIPSQMTLDSLLILFASLHLKWGSSVYLWPFLFVLFKGVREDHKGQDLGSGVWSIRRDLSGHIWDEKLSMQGEQHNQAWVWSHSVSGLLWDEGREAPGRQGWGEVGVWSDLLQDLAFIIGKEERNCGVKCRCDGNGTQLPKHKLQVGVVERVHFQGDGVLTAGLKTPIKVSPSTTQRTHILQGVLEVS